MLIHFIFTIEYELVSRDTPLRHSHLHNFCTSRFNHWLGDKWDHEEEQVAT